MDRSTIKMHHNSSIPWRSDAGQALMTSLIFSENARKSAIARELYIVQSYHVLIKTVTIGGMIPTLTAVAAHFNEHFNISRFPLRARLAWHSFCTVLALGATVFAFDQVHKHYERAADRAVAQLGEEYLQGAVEYSSKRMLANRALRELLGHEGQRTYSPAGDVRHWLWDPHVALSERKAFFEKQLQQSRAVVAKEEPVSRSE